MQRDPHSGPVPEAAWAADAAARARFYLDQPPAGLATAAPPSIDSVPNSHRGYAGQWFFFAAAASVIYTLAVRRRA